jgi:AraC-like DNA-binding protein
MEDRKLSGAWVLEAFRRGGVDTELLSRRLPDDVELMLNELDTIPADSLNRLFEVCAETSGDADFGLTMNELVDISMYGLFGYLLQNSGTVKDLFNTLVRYHSVYHDRGIFYEMLLNKDSVAIRFSYEQVEFSSHRHTTDWGLGFVPRFLEKPLGNLARPMCAHFVYDRPRDLLKLKKYFGCDLHFNQAHNELVYHPSILTRKITNVDQLLLKVLRQQANRYLVKHQKDASLQKKLNMHLFENLSCKKANTTDVAVALNMSLSTFKRRLATEGIDFKQTKEQVRNDLAKKLLAKTSLQVSEVAQKTGFSNPGSFTRFFIRCNQEKPLTYRNTFKMNPRQA